MMLDLSDEDWREFMKQSSRFSRLPSINSIYIKASSDCDHNLNMFLCNIFPEKIRLFILEGPEEEFTINLDYYMEGLKNVCKAISNQIKFYAWKGRIDLSW